MKKTLVSFLEGAIVGLVLGFVLAILDIDITAFQIAIVVAAAIISTSIASTIAQMINTGKTPVFYEWVYDYDGNRIVVSTGFKETLYINDELADEKKGITIKQVALNGHLKSGEEVNAVIKGGMTVTCELHVGNELLKPVATKVP